VIRKTIIGLGLCLLFLPGQARSQNQPEVFTETKHDVSPALRDIPQIAPSVGPKHEKPLRMTHGPGEFAPQPDPVLQSFAGALVSTTAGLNFQGVGVGLGVGVVEGVAVGVGVGVAVGVGVGVGPPTGTIAYA